ncbi:potassium channel family protein [Arthrobacter pigmenti]
MGYFEDRSTPRQQLLLALLRPVLSGIALLVVYYVLPLDRSGRGTAPALVVGLGVLAILIAWQVRAVMTAPSPRMRAVEALVTSIAFYIVLFAASYVAMSNRDPAAFTEPLDRTDALYFTITTLATVGFGDITAVSQAARIAITIQMVTGLVLLGLVIRLFLGAVQIGLRHAGEGDVGSASQAGGTAGPGNEDDTNGAGTDTGPTR